MSDIERELGVDRSALVHLALLLGSDYTEGIAGIGVVNAMEVLHAFPGLTGLREFKSWIDSPEEALTAAMELTAAGRGKGRGRGRGGSSRGGRGRGRGGADAAGAADAAADGEEGSGSQASQQQQQQEGGAPATSAPGSSQLTQPSLHPDSPAPQAEPQAAAAAAAERMAEYKRTHLKARGQWQLPPSFPSPAVVEAYLKPHVDRDKARFSWGSLQGELLREYCRWGGWVGVWHPVSTGVRDAMSYAMH